LQIKVFTLLFILYGVGCASSRALLSLSGIWALALALYYIFNDFKKNKLSPYRKSIYFSILAYAIFTIVNTLFKEAPAFSIKAAITAAPLIIIPFAALSPFFKKLKINLRLIILVTALAYLTSAIYCLYQSFYLKTFGGSFFKINILYAYNSVVAFCFFFEHWISIRKNKNTYTYFILTTTLFILIALVCCGSAMAPFVAAVYFFTRILYLSLSYKNYKMLLLIALPIIPALLVVNYNSHVAKKLKTFTGEVKNNSFLYRTRIWKQSFLSIKEKPFTGKGYDNSGIDYKEIFRKKKPYNRKSRAHNIYIQKLAEGGIIGFFLFFYALLGLFILMPAARPILAIVFITGLTDTNFMTQVTYHPIYFFLLLTSLSKKDKELSQAST